MIPKIYGYLAALVFVLLVLGGLYAKGRLDADHAGEVKKWRDDYVELRLDYDREQTARADDALKARQAAERLTALNTQVANLQEYADGLEDANAQCLSGPDVDRLRDLWK